MAHYSGVYSAPRAVILGRELEAQMRHSSCVVGYRSNMCDGRDHWLAGRLSPRWLAGLVIWEMSVYHVDAGRVGRQHAPDAPPRGGGDAHSGRPMHSPLP